MIQTARNAYIATEAAGLSYDVSLHWNVIPWLVARPDKPDRRTRDEIKRARPYLIELITEHVHPRVVILSGGPAQKAWDQAIGVDTPTGIFEPLRCPHPSPLAFPKAAKATERLNSELIIETFAHAMRLVG